MAVYPGGDTNDRFYRALGTQMPTLNGESALREPGHPSPAPRQQWRARPSRLRAHGPGIVLPAPSGPSWKSPARPEARARLRGRNSGHFLRAARYVACHCPAAALLGGGGRAPWDSHQPRPAAARASGSFWRFPAGLPPRPGRPRRLSSSPGPGRPLQAPASPRRAPSPAAADEPRGERAPGSPQRLTLSVKLKLTLAAELGASLSPSVKWGPYQLCLPHSCSPELKGIRLSPESQPSQAMAVCSLSVIPRPRELVTTGS
ncbi:translation initiation factor IF-2-like [Choloepus didactylus]|uniref:translation initiation factor IF-2-like n=1 Tax=Choloepus didactylus TaxID=27675 RepID=UPI00189FFA32|nr:translation initiation factor IF-2-like [Choloepus didactylus]